MITSRNEFETVPAFEHIAGSSFGNWSNRETTCAMLDALETVQSKVDCAPLWKVIAENHDESDIWFDVQQEIADHLNYYMPIPDYCSVRLQDNEWLVLPDLESAQEECKTYSDYPDGNEGGENTILVVNDHGNVTCQQWSAIDMDYVTIWDMV